jgi:NAD+ diphosphatase
VPIYSDGCCVTDNLMDFGFAFRAGELNRAAHLRVASSTRDDPRRRTLVFWRGKLLVDASGKPLRVEFGHPALCDGRDEPVFVGLTPAGPLFATDLSGWSPLESSATIGQYIDQSQQQHHGFADAIFVEIRGVMPTLSRLEGECVATGRALIGWHATHQFCANCGAATLPQSTGWLRKCPKCATQHFPRTDPVVIMAITRGERLLLGRGSSWPERMYSLLAGFVEPGETIEAAVRRETIEESSIAVGRVRYVASQPWPFPMSLMLGCHGQAESERITIDRAELADARWVTRDEVFDLLAGTHVSISAPRPGAIAGALIEAWAHGKLLDGMYWGN